MKALSLFLGIAFVMAGLLAIASPAAAHAQYLASTPASGAILPAAPARVTVTLSENVDPASASIRVTNSTGARVDQNGTRVLGSDPRVLSTDLSSIGPGVYTVAWRASSAVDGHPTAGSFAFGVQNPDGSLPGPVPGAQTTANPSADPVEVAVRAGSFLAMTACAGALAFIVLMWGPASSGLAGPQAEQARAGLRRLLMWAGGNAFGLAAFATAWLALAMRNALEAGAAPSFVSSSFFVALEARIALAAACGALVFVILWRSRTAQTGALWIPMVLAAALAFAAVLTTSIASHSAAALQWQPYGIAADGLHLIGVSVWVGGVLALVVASGHLRSAGGPELPRGVLERFAKVAFTSVGIVLLAGLTLGLIQIGSVERVTASTYGWVVLAKVSLFAPMVALGAHNHYKSIPLLSDGKRAAEALTRVVKNVRVEAALGAVVLVLAGLLTTLAPGSAVTPPAPPFALEETRDGLTIEFQISPPPGPPGVYTVSLAVSNATAPGHSPNATNASLRFTLVNSTTPPTETVLYGPHEIGPGVLHFFNDTPAMAQPGTWRVDAIVKRSDSFDVRVTFNVNIRGT